VLISSGAAGGGTTHEPNQGQTKKNEKLLLLTETYD